MTVRILESRNEFCDIMMLWMLWCNFTDLFVGSLLKPAPFGVDNNAQLFKVPGLVILLTMFHLDLLKVSILTQFFWNGMKQPSTVVDYVMPFSISKSLYMFDPILA